MKVRELRARDVKTLAKMLGKLNTDSIEGVFQTLNGKENFLQVGLSLFHIVAADLTDDIYGWLADLIGVTPEVLDDMPVSTPIDIISELINRGDFKDFFGSVMQRAEQMVGSTTLSSPGISGQTEK